MFRNDVVLQRDRICRTLSRKKTFADEPIEPGKEKLERALSVFDLTALGVGATLGCGVYVLAGTVAKSVAGPAVILSFILAAVVSSFSGRNLSAIEAEGADSTRNMYP